MKYQTKLNIIDADQYKGPGKPFELPGVQLKSNEGTGGYAKKLAYIFHPMKGPVVVRPMDYVLVDNGEVMVMSPHAFEKLYEPLTDNNKTVKRKVFVDNSQ
jgi:hypothetical protein